MAVETKVTKEMVVKCAFKLVKKEGWEAVNARSLAKVMGTSTKPLYRLYSGMDEIMKDTYQEIYNDYDAFINQRIDNKNALITLCVAYVEYARDNKNLFKSLFLSNNLEWHNIDNVLDEKWNQSAIINMVNKHGYSFEEAKSAFMHVWLYANGLATLIAANDISLDTNEIITRIVKIFKELKNK